MDLFTAKGAIEVEEPRLYKDAFPYEDFPKNAFNDAVVKKIYGENVCISVEGTLNFNMQ